MSERRPSGAMLRYSASAASARNLAWQCRAVGMPAPALEYRFDPARRWRFDLAWAELGIAVEIDGGAWTGGRHVRGGGFEADAEKLNAAAAAGWRVFRFAPRAAQNGAAFQFLRPIIERAFRAMPRICELCARDLSDEERRGTWYALSRRR